MPRLVAPSDCTAEATEPVGIRDQSGDAYVRMYVVLYADSLRWFARTGIPALVMTSGNVSDLPIVITSEDAEAQLAGKVAIILHHNRPIYNRVDDSVLQVCGGQPFLIRRSRGYVPEPFFTDTNVEGIMAFGAEKVNTFALGKGETILQSQYIGDLKNWETFRFYAESMERFRHLFRFSQRRLVCDLHPDYLSSQEAERMSESSFLAFIKGTTSSCPCRRLYVGAWIE